jgi:hypothetical protein
MVQSAGRNLVLVILLSVVAALVTIVVYGLVKKPCWWTNLWQQTNANCTPPTSSDDSPGCCCDESTGTLTPSTSDECNDPDVWTKSSDCSQVTCKKTTPARPVVQCNASCKTNSDCANATGGCTGCTLGFCTIPGCATQCDTDTDCNGGNGGCNKCITNTCTKTGCNLWCKEDSDCAGNNDGCTSCSGNFCAPPSPKGSYGWNLSGNCAERPSYATYGPFDDADCTVLDSSVETLQTFLPASPCQPGNVPDGQSCMQCETELYSNLASIGPDGFVWPGLSSVLTITNNYTNPVALNMCLSRGTQPCGPLTIYGYKVDVPATNSGDNVMTAVVSVDTSSPVTQIEPGTSVCVFNPFPTASAITNPNNPTIPVTIFQAYDVADATGGTAGPKTTVPSQYQQIACNAWNCLTVNDDLSMTFQQWSY